MVFQVWCRYMCVVICNDKSFLFSPKILFFKIGPSTLNLKTTLAQSLKFFFEKLTECTCIKGEWLLEFDNCSLCEMSVIVFRTVCLGDVLKTILPISDFHRCAWNKVCWSRWNHQKLVDGFSNSQGFHTKREPKKWNSEKNDGNNSLKVHTRCRAQWILILPLLNIGCRVRLSSLSCSKKSKVSKSLRCEDFAVSKKWAKVSKIVEKDEEIYEKVSHFFWYDEHSYTWEKCLYRANDLKNEFISGAIVMTWFSDATKS